MISNTCSILFLEKKIIFLADLGQTGSGHGPDLEGQGPKKIGPDLGQCRPNVEKGWM